MSIFVQRLSTKYVNIDWLFWISLIFEWNLQTEILMYLDRAIVRAGAFAIVRAGAFAPTVFEKSQNNTYDLNPQVYMEYELKFVPTLFKS